MENCCKMAVAQLKDFVLKIDYNGIMISAVFPVFVGEMCNDYKHNYYYSIKTCSFMQK